MYNDELYHHGILGQRWGKRNGPPYPLSRSVSQRVSSRKNRGILGYLAERKAKKEAEKKSKVEKEEAARKKLEEEAKARHDADRERVLREGSATEVLAYKNELTNQELSNALNRIRWRNDLTKLAAEEADAGWNSIDKIMKKFGNVKDWAKTAAEFYKAIDDVQKIYERRRQENQG